MAMSANGRGASFDPVRIQKLLFLIDREAAAYVDGPHFEFQPYLYGPFDKAVYEELDALRDDGKVLVRGADSPRSYTLTASGHEDGAAGLAEIPTEARQYMEQAARWVLSVRFEQLLSGIYRKYPDMAVNGIVPESTPRYPGVSRRPRVPPFLSGMARTLDITGVLGRNMFGKDSDWDARAIHSDWCAVGNDLRVAMANQGHPPNEPDTDGS